MSRRNNLNAVTGKTPIPADPQAAVALRRWSDKVGVGLGWHPTTARYPRVCRHGHRIDGPQDEHTERAGGRVLRYCAECRRRTWRRRGARYRAARKSAKSST